jgi:nucleoside phosphorylase
MKLYLVPFNAEAKVLTAILPNCRKVSNSSFQNRWEYKGGEIICWNKVGIEPIKEVIMKIGNFENYSSVILFGSAGSLAPDLHLGKVYSCTTIKDIENKLWQMPTLEGIETNSLLTTNELIFDNDLRMKYHKEFNCNLVDMEASIFAELSIQGFFKQAKTFIVRFISDNYDTLPQFNLATNNYTKDFLLKANSEIVKYRKLLI